jgi:putative effector of murein hydrolase
MQTKMSTAINVVLAIAVVALAINAYDTQQQLDSRLLDSSNAVDKINASIAAIKTQEQGQIIDDLVAKQKK